MARSLVGHIDPKTCGGTETLTDLDADALAMEANALRVQGDFRMSLRTLAKARMTQRRGGIEPDLRAKIDLLESSLRRDLWQFDLALALLDRATEDFVALGDQERVARAIVGRANVYLVKGDWSSAAAILRIALDWPFDSKITLWARHNLADVLVKAGRALEAAQVFAATQALYDRCTDVLTTNRCLWVEGLIARELGDDLKHATDLIEQATESFIAHGYAHDAALAQLDLRATRRRLKDSGRARSQRLPQPLHAHIAPAQQHAHPAGTETSIGEGSGQAGGARRLYDHS
jgi:tetratricopeptide (TPR) repeat protein